MLHARLFPHAGFWAIQFDGDKRPNYTRFKDREDVRRVLRFMQREYPGAEIEIPTDPAWLFSLDELRPFEEQSDLFA
jgi:hypothetical protein